MSNTSLYSTKSLTDPQTPKWVKMMKIHVRFWPNRFRFEKYDRKTVWGARNNPTSASEPSETLNSHILCTIYAPILGGANFQHLELQAEWSGHRKSDTCEKELGLSFSKIYTCWGFPPTSSFVCTLESQYPPSSGSLGNRIHIQSVILCVPVVNKVDAGFKGLGTRASNG